MTGNHHMDGTRAFNRGIERDRCPHAPGTDAFKSWMAGWNQQRTEFQVRLQFEAAAMQFRKAG